MDGYKLREANYIEMELDDAQIWSAFEKVFSSRSKNTSSYKYVFLKSLMNCIMKGKTVLSFTEVYEQFVVLYWPLITKWKLKQTNSKRRITEIEKIISDFLVATDYTNLSEATDEELDSLINKAKNQCSRYVVGALYGDTQGIFYSFSKGSQKIMVNPRVASFICNHILSIEELLYYDLAKYFCKVNSQEYFDAIISMANIKYEDNLFYARSIIAIELEGKETDLQIAQSENDLIKKQKLAEDYKVFEQYLDNPEELMHAMLVSKGIKWADFVDR